MGLREKYAKRDAEVGFEPWELNEHNVQAMFNRCVATEKTERITGCYLFPETDDERPERLIRFDADAVTKNKKAIEYLYGQLKKVHDEQTATRITIDDYVPAYHGTYWTTDQVAMLKFLYLGVTPEALVISPFRAEDHTSIISPRIKPTLSPKDPNFPAWWEAHRHEWED